jgi:2-polyprenyl-3-methyl-5-hydroxy-6-metoxy-1,4-benzoquinol methylase
MNIMAANSNPAEACAMPAMNADRYALGYSEREFRRLRFQGEFFRDVTEDVFRRAGLGPGMRVLDIGCGVGDVSLLAAEMVGPSGEILGLDRSPEAIAVARSRAAPPGSTMCATKQPSSTPSRRAGGSTPSWGG